jgi:5-methylcytosine-specific restriction endonuclease McrA
MTVSDQCDDHQWTQAMRAPCPDCGCTDGTIATVNGQDTVRCAECRRFCYNAPRTETGRPRRSLRSRPEIKPSQRARIFELDNWTCVVCKRGDVPLHIGHFISVADAKAQGLSEAELYDDENLLAICAECKLGQGPRRSHCGFGLWCYGRGSPGNGARRRSHTRQRSTAVGPPPHAG